jgi:shikimate 5-dehydrogenase
MSETHARLQPRVTNELPPIPHALVTGIIGDQPSRYAKTPLLWNAVYRELGWDAVSLPWDVSADGLAGFVAAARDTPAVAGMSVTIPYKTAIMPLLDDLDPLARQIGAVNTVVRESGNRFVGYNTDGQGAIDALTRHLPGNEGPFVPSLAGRRVLLLGAGGAARAVAFYLGAALGSNGALRIVNRDARKAADLAAAVRDAYGVGESGSDDRLDDWLPDADLVINATVKGQSGWRRLPDGTFTHLEAYAALGPPADERCRVPAGVPLDAEASRRWFAGARHDLAANLARAVERTATLAPHAACFDLVYSPLETRFLQLARLAGHRTQNGKWMNIAQAADAFARKVCTRALAERGLGVENGYARALEIMTRVW